MRAGLKGEVSRRETARRPGSRLTGLAYQFGLVSLAALAYFGVRGLTQSSHEAAARNAERLVAVQDHIALSVESGVQAAVISHSWLVTLVNWIYIFGHWPLIIVVLVVLYLRAPPRFRLLRNALFASGAIGLVIFALFPVAPPRLGVLEVVDTVTERSTTYRALQPPSLTNPYAALPSLHFGWNLLVGIALWQFSTNVAVRTFAVMMPLLMAFAVVATANHYVIDIAAGGVVALAGLAIAQSITPEAQTHAGAH
jgi:hypothetical protein